MENHGVRYGQRPTDYVAGAFTFVSFEERNPSGDWTPYLGVGERQFSSPWPTTGFGDTMSCVSFSAMNCLEVQYKFLTGVEINLSDRWIAKMSGTTMEGNYLYAVGDAVRNLGVVLESDYPAPAAPFTFDKYHEPIQEPLLSQLLDKGKAWKSEWDVKTEFVPATKEDMLHHLKHAPLQIVIPGHAIMNFLCEQDVVNYFDTYEPYKKITAYANITSAYKYILTKKTMDKPKTLIVNDGGKLYVVVLQGFCVGGAAAKSMEALGQLKAALEVPADAPTYDYPQT